MTTLWERLKAVEAYRIVEVPRREDPGLVGAGGRYGTAGDTGRPQRAAALAAAYHEMVAAPEAGEGLIAYGWIRPAEGGPVHVIAAGRSLTGSVGQDDRAGVMLALPGGARAQIMPEGALGRLLTALPCWREVAVISDSLLAAPAPEGTATPSLEDCFLASWAGAFGWLVVAEALPQAALRTLASEVADRLHLAEATADRFPERAVNAQRLKDRHVELRRGFSTGAWRLWLAGGAATATAAARVAGLLCASADTSGLPYALSPAATETDRQAACVSTELVAALARPPQVEVPGLRLRLAPEFDVTPDALRYDTVASYFALGEILDRNGMPVGEFSAPADSLNRHVFVCGATGAGKSQTVRALLESATVPWLVIEPAKAEYRLMANRGRDVIRIRPGEPDAVAAGVNPLEPAAGFPLQTHADLVKALFVAAFQAEEPFPQVLSAALSRSYEEAGWDLALGEPLAEGTARPDYPQLADLQRAAEAVVAEIGYSQRITDDVLGFMKVRLSSLRFGTSGRFLAGGHPVDFGKLLRSNVVLEIEDVGDDRDKAFLMGAVLIRLAEHLRVTPREHKRLNHLTVVEEAHRLLRRTGSEQGAAAHAVEMFAGLLAELRAYGEGMIIAEQIPARLVPDVIKNTAIKIVHRLPAADDRDAVGATINLTPAQSRYLVTLAPGEAAAFSDGMDLPILIKVKDGTEREMVTAPVTRDASSVVRQGVPRAVPSVSPGPARCGRCESRSERSPRCPAVGCGRSSRCSRTWRAGRCRCRGQVCSVRCGRCLPGSPNARSRTRWMRRWARWCRLSCRRSARRRSRRTSARRSGRGSAGTCGCASRTSRPGGWPS